MLFWFVSWKLVFTRICLLDKSKLQSTAMHRHEIFYISNKSPKAKYIDTQIKLFIIYYDNKSAVLKFTVIDDSV